MRIPPLILALISLVIAVLVIFAPQSVAQTDERLVLVATVDGPITPVVARYLDRAVDRAEERDAAALVIQLDTPGGLGSAMDDIVDDILASDVPVVVYVAPVAARAASAGVFITYAAHVAAMAPSTNIGSASPILTGGDGSIEVDETLERKVMNDAIARITNLAELRGRNVDWAVSAVRDAANITAQQALDIGVVDLIAQDLETLLIEIDGRTVATASGNVTLTTANARTDEIGFTWIEELLQLLAEPTLAYLLVSFGLLGLYVELSNPGLGAPGIFGGIALMLGLLGLGSLPVAWVGLALMALAFVLFIIDLFVPSLGLLTVGGLLAFLIGSNILIADNTPSDLQVPREIVWTMTACLAAGAALIGLAVVKGQFRRTRTGKRGMIGRVGTVRTDLDPDGMVYVFGEIWSATAFVGSIPAGTAVTVEDVQGLHMRVRPATAAEIAASDVAGDRRSIIPVR